jgi:hypothetical protein
MLHLGPFRKDQDVPHGLGHECIRLKSNTLEPATAGYSCPDSEVRIIPRHLSLRTSDSKDTSELLI